MSKPTVFFSHSSADKKAITKLKDLLVKKTGGTIDFFSSSDGQSIPLGKNWVHSIEKALNGSSIMFVFITPNSIHSNWIYFESGFSYSKDIKVVPIGFLGIDLTRVEPPLSLLQGFNLSSHESLNNILSVINTEFKFSHEESFTREDFDLLESLSINKSGGPGSEFLGIADHISLSLHDTIKISGEEVNISGDVLQIIKQYFEEHKIDFRAINNMVEIQGLIIRKYTSSNSPTFYEVTIDSIIYKLNFKYIKELLIRIYNDELKNFYLRIYLGDGFKLLFDTYKISARLLSYGIKFSDIDRAFKFKNIDFVTESAASSLVLRILYSVNDLDNFKLEELLELLLEAGVITEKY